jgi:ABC-type glycerol-3-phosphate transport system substrate-binding protein
LLVLIVASALLYDQPYGNTDTPETVNITYWEKWTGFEGEAMKAGIEYFNDKKVKNKKGQIIHCDCLTTTNVDRKSLMAIAGGTPPDLCGFWTFNTNVFADMGALTPLDDFIARDGYDMNQLVDVYRKTCMYRAAGDDKEHVYCLITTPASIALHWNKEMFKEAGLDPERPPRTIEELNEYNEKLTKRDANGKIVQMGFLPIEPGWWNWAWGYFFDGKLNDGLEKLTANDPRNIKAWEWVVSFGDDKECRTKEEKDQYRARLQAFSSSFSSAFDSPQNAFMAGKVAMVLQGVWMANFIRFHNPHLQWGCGPMPAGFDTQGQPVTIAEADVISIPKGCKHPEEAWEVIKFLNSREGQEYVCGRAVNTVTGKVNSGGHGKQTAFKENTPGWIEQHPHQYLRTFIELAKSKNAQYTPQLPIWEEYRRELNDAFDRAWLGKATPAEALQSVQNRMQPKLDRALKIRSLHEGKR